MSKDSNIFFDEYGNLSTIGTVSSTVLSLILILFAFWFFPMYGMWCNQLDVKTASLKGQAKLMRANQDRQIRVTEAKTNLEAMNYKRQTIVMQAKAFGEAEKVKAKGVAEANKIIDQSLTPRIIQNNYLKSLSNIKGNLYFTNGNSMPAVMFK